MSILDTQLQMRQWLGSPQGQYLTQKEQAYFDAVVVDIFGFHALQLGMEQCDLLRASRIPLRLSVGLNDGVDLCADYGELPFDSNSIDLIVMPHTLEFSDHPHQVMREVSRVLRPDGQVVIAGFNPMSLWGVRRSIGTHTSYPWNGQFIQLPRVKDWLELVGLEINAGSMACYIPPCSQQKWIDRLQWMEMAGDRWWPIAGGVFFLRAIKRVRSMRLIMPKWRAQRVAKKNLAAVSERVHDDQRGQVGINSSQRIDV